MWAELPIKKATVRERPAGSGYNRPRLSQSERAAQNGVARAYLLESLCQFQDNHLASQTKK